MPRQPAVLVTIMLLLGTSVRAAYIPTDMPSPAPSNTEPESAMGESGLGDLSLCYEDKIRNTWSEQRIELFKQEILAKLNLDAEPDNPPEAIDLELVDEEVLAAYRATLARNEAAEGQEENGGQLSAGCAEEKQSFYAKEVKLFFPSHFHGEPPPINMFDWGKPVHECVQVLLSQALCMARVNMFCSTFPACMQWLQTLCIVPLCEPNIYALLFKVAILICIFA